VRAITLEYHDVVEPGQWEASGFPGVDSATYKLELPLFEAHLKDIADLDLSPIGSSLNVTAPGPRVFITFDDGGVSAFDPIADLLEDRGWRGHFFVTTRCIDTPRFLSRGQIRELSQRGHVIGSHSASHPPRMSALSREQLTIEWRESTDTLAQILGQSTATASVPGGHYSSVVARTAAANGLKVLFTSEPTAKGRLVDGCWVLGRYTLRHRSSARYAAAIADGHLTPRGTQWALWNAKKVAKWLGGAAYLKVRKRVLGRR